MDLHFLSSVFLFQVLSKGTFRAGLSVLQEPWLPHPISQKGWTLVIFWLIIRGFLFSCPVRETWSVLILATVGFAPAATVAPWIEIVRTGCAEIPVIVTRVCSTKAFSIIPFCWNLINFCFSDTPKRLYCYLLLGGTQGRQKAQLRVDHQQIRLTSNF